MCGRFVSASPPEEIGKYFDTADVAEKLLEPSYNVAPTNDVYVVTEDGGTRRLDAYHWGLVPFWAKSPAAGSKMINARAETIAEKNAYRRPFAKRRCIIPADGFYEWKKIPGQKAKQPYFITRRDEEPLAFAGIWEIWRGPDKAKDKDAAEQLRSCTIITTVARTRRWRRSTTACRSSSRRRSGTSGSIPATTTPQPSASCWCPRRRRSCACSRSAPRSTTSGTRVRS